MKWQRWNTSPLSLQDNRRAMLCLRRTLAAIVPCRSLQDGVAMQDTSRDCALSVEREGGEPVYIDAIWFASRPTSVRHAIMSITRMHDLSYMGDTEDGMMCFARLPVSTPGGTN